MATKDKRGTKTLPLPMKELEEDLFLSMIVMLLFVFWFIIMLEITIRRVRLLSQIRRLMAITSNPNTFESEEACNSSCSCL